MAEPKYLIDTNLCIYILQGKSEPAARRLSECQRGHVVTSAIAYAEVMIGAEERNEGDHALAFFAQVPVIPFDEEAGRAYSKLPFKRGSYDRLIAAQAIALGLTVATGNSKDFAGIPGLKVEDWTQ